MESDSKFSKAILIITLIAVTFFLVGSFVSRLANSNGDDHPVVWARYFANPAFWEGDGGFFLAQQFGVATLPNIIAIYAVKLNTQLPILLSWIYIFIQNIGIGLAFYFLATLWVKEKWLAATVALLSYSMTPWQLNLAYYPSMIHSPYSGHLVMPFIAFAAYFLLTERTLYVSVCLAIAGLIHPSQTLQFIFLGVVFLLISDKTSRRVIHLSSLIPPLLASLIIPFIFLPKPANPLTDNELLPSALLNPHLIPWESTTFWPWGVPSLIGCFFLSYIACLELSKNNSKLKAFWWANLISLLVLGLGHFIGGKLKILSIILLCPFRVSVINSVLLAPIGFSYLIKKITGKNLRVCFTAATLVFFLLLSKSGFFWGPLLALLFYDRNKTEKHIGKIFYGVLVLWWVLFLLVGRPLREVLGPDISGFFRSIMAPGFSLNVLKIWLALGLTLLVSLFRRWSFKREKAMGFGLFILAAVFTIIQSYQTGSEATQGELKARWDLQIWAKTSTPPDSIFLIEWGSWRGVSERKTQVVGYRENSVLAYFRLRNPKEAEIKLQKLYEPYHTKKYSELPDTGVSIFADTFNGDYFVDAAELPKRKFAICFENSRWRVYAVGKKADCYKSEIAKAGY